MVERMKRMAFFKLSPQKTSSLAVSTLPSVKDTTMVGRPKMRDTAKAIAHLLARRRGRRRGRRGRRRRGRRGRRTTLHEIIAFVQSHFRKWNVQPILTPPPPPPPPPRFCSHSVLGWGDYRSVIQT